MSTYSVTLNLTDKEASVLKLVLTYVLGDIDVQTSKLGVTCPLNAIRSGIINILESLSKNYTLTIYSAGSDLTAFEYVVSNALSHSSIDKDEAIRSSIMGKGLVGLSYIVLSEKDSIESIVKKFNEAAPDLTSFIG